MSHVSIHVPSKFCKVHHKQGGVSYEDPNDPNSRKKRTTGRFSDFGSISKIASLSQIAL